MAHLPAQGRVGQEHRPSWSTCLPLGNAPFPEAEKPAGPAFVPLASLAACARRTLVKGVACKTYANDRIQMRQIELS